MHMQQQQQHMQLHMQQHVQHVQQHQQHQQQKRPAWMIAGRRQSSWPVRTS
jgi:hypothetical protein